MFASLFVGPVIFFLLLFAFFVFFAMFEDSNDQGWAGLLTVLLLLFAFFITDPFGAVFSWMFAHSTEALMLAVTYLSIGALYSAIKWWRFLAAKVDKFREYHDVTSSQYTTDLKRFLQSQPTVKNSKSRLFVWVLYWPASALFLILNDPLTKIGKWIVAHMGGVYQYIDDLVYGDLRRELDQRNGK